MKPIDVLIACECSDVVKMAFRKQDIPAWSCDLKPSEHNEEHHVRGDVRTFLRGITEGELDLLIAHPDCTYLASSGLHWNHRTPGRDEKTKEALEFVRWLMSLPIPHICIENPIGCIPTHIDTEALGFEKQTIQPYQFGEDASKATCLFLKGLPKLTPTQYIEPRIVNGKKRWGNQTDSGQNKLAPSPTRKADRSRTYQGIADAMAQQWGDYLSGQPQ